MEEQNEDPDYAWELKHDGELKFTGTADQCWVKLLKSQSQSTDYARKYGGWSITNRITGEVM